MRTSIYIILNIYTVRGREREGESREGSEEVTEVLFLRSDLSVLCLFSVWCLSVSSFWFSVRCSLSINRSQLSSARVNCFPKVGGLRSPEASKLARIITYGEIMFLHTMWESSSFLFLLTCSVLDVKSHLSRQHILNQLETAVLDSTHTMHKHLHQDEVQL